MVLVVFVRGKIHSQHHFFLAWFNRSSIIIGNCSGGAGCGLVVTVGARSIGCDGVEAKKLSSCRLPSRFPY